MAALRVARHRPIAPGRARLLLSLIWLPVLGAVALSACAGLPLLGQSSQDTISPAEAAKVVRDYWKVNEQAVVTRNAELFAKIQSGPLLQSDVADTRSAQATGDPPPKVGRPLNKVTAVVPHQNGYPAQFVALVETVKVDASGNLSKDPVGLYHHFARAANDAPWKADFAAVVPTDHLARFSVDRDGYTTLLSSGSGGSQLVLDPKQLPNGLARYINSGLSAGSPEGPFAPGRLTTDAIAALRHYRDGMGRLGYTVDLSYQPADFVAAYREADGGAVVLFALQATSNVGVPDPSHCIVQPKDNLHRWGGLVPPGSYLRLIEGRLLQFVASDPARKAGAAIDVPAYAESQVSATTTPANPACH